MVDHRSVVGFTGGEFFGNTFLFGDVGIRSQHLRRQTVFVLLRSSTHVDPAPGTVAMVHAHIDEEQRSASGKMIGQRLLRGFLVSGMDQFTPGGASAGDFARAVPQVFEPTIRHGCLIGGQIDFPKAVIDRVDRGAPTVFAVVERDRLTNDRGFGVFAARLQAGQQGGQQGAERQADRQRHPGTRATGIGQLGGTQGDFPATPGEGETTDRTGIIRRGGEDTGFTNHGWTLRIGDVADTHAGLITHQRQGAQQIGTGERRVNPTT